MFPRSLHPFGEVPKIVLGLGASSRGHKFSLCSRHRRSMKVNESSKKFSFSIIIFLVSEFFAFENAACILNVSIFHPTRQPEHKLLCWNKFFRKLSEEEKKEENPSLSWVRNRKLSFVSHDGVFFLAFGFEKKNWLEKKFLCLLDIEGKTRDNKIMKRNLNFGGNENVSM